MATRRGFTVHGFWDYTCPGTGGMEGYESDDYKLLLEDMSEAGMNSVVVMCKWLTTGYRSSLPFLDQHESNLVTHSDNTLIQDFIRAAHGAGIEVWIGAVVTMYPAEKVSCEPSLLLDHYAFDRYLPVKVGVFDLDCPVIHEYAVSVFEELHQLFGECDGFLAELEFGDCYRESRRVPYDAWAADNGEPDFDSIGRPFTSRSIDISSWRRYTTTRRVEVVSSIEHMLRSRGYTGKLAMLCETGCVDNQISQEVDLDLFHRGCPDWAAVSYDQNYDKSRFRRGLMEMAVEEPKRAGMDAYYLPRGVMTFGGDWPMSMSLKEMWRAQIEDAELYEPDGVWWFGSGTGRVPEGAHVGIRRLLRSGYEDGREARLALMKLLRANREQMPGESHDHLSR